MHLPEVRQQALQKNEKGADCMRRTIREVKNLVSKTGKKFQVVKLEGDEQDYSNWDLKNELKSGDEIECELEQKGNFWNLSKVKMLNDAARGTQIDVQTQTQKSDKELRAFLAEKAAGCACVMTKNETEWLEWFGIIYTKMYTQVFEAKEE
jgi:hypothetical protein